MTQKETSMIKQAWEEMNKPRQVQVVSKAILSEERAVSKNSSDRAEWVANNEAANLSAKTFSRNSRNSLQEVVEDNKGKEGLPGLSLKETISCFLWKSILWMR